ncbi:hypothetical protein J2741_002606 [Methanolinea mesophila]|uniref:YIP1 family protein n=1 Tax=Methanolinea mesophila TaxID=547055 RepID=UPI001AE4C874|nr:Yip1 family protein [Methanolinea mesophila]MBP1930010.1 hypothetical protein [Methanolinea mesophila]
MLDNFVEKLKGFLLKPVETFQMSREDSLGTTFAYYIVLAIISAILVTIVYTAVASLSPLASLPGFAGLFPLFIFVFLIVAYIIGPFIGGAWVHIFVWLFGGRKGYIQTVKAMMYAATPSFLLSWIPLVSIIGSIWTLILEIIGIRELHEISTGRAVAAVIIPIVIIVIIIALIVAAFVIAAVSTMTMSPVPY